MTHRYVPTIAQVMITTTVPAATWRWLGQSTFFSSAQHSATKRRPPPRPRGGPSASSAAARLGAHAWRLRACCETLACCCWPSACWVCCFCRTVPAALLAGAPGHYLPRLTVRGMPAAPAAVLSSFASKRSGVFRFDFSV